MSALQEQPILLLGASTRAAAESLSRVEIKTLSFDIFSDWDLEKISQVTQLSNYPVEILDHIHGLNDYPLIYTGAIENDSELLETLSNHLILLGNSAEQIRKVRDPKWLISFCQRNKIAFPETILSDTQEKLNSSDATDWLIKKRNSAAGLEIVSAKPTNKLKSNQYLQKEISGTPCSAVILSNSKEAKIVGVTKQLSGESFLNTHFPYQYAGNIAPFKISKHTRAQIKSCINAMHSETQLKGVWGIDGIISENQFFLLEVNPRYTASCELFEKLYDVTLLEKQISIFQHDEFNWNSNQALQHDNEVLSKAILYAPSEIKITNEIFSNLCAAQAKGEIADVPHLNSIIETGHPICTIFVSSADEKQAYSDLQNKAEDWYQTLLNKSF